MKISSKSIFFLNLVFIILIGFLIINNSTAAGIYDLLFSDIYVLLIFILMVIAFIIVLFREKLRIHDKKEKLFRFLSYIIFAPMVFYPLFRCYFKIPYIFCRVCPRKCIFGHLRPYTVPAVLLLNIDKRAWCHKYCPIGKLQDKQLSIKSKKIVLPKFLSYIKYLFLLFIVISYFIISRKNPIGFYNYFFKNAFSVSIIVLIIGVLLFLVSFFIHRFWCNYICPIGTVSEEILKAESKIG